MRHEDEAVEMEPAAACGTSPPGQTAHPHQGHRHRGLPQRLLPAVPLLLRVQLQCPLCAAPPPTADGQVHGQLGPAPQPTQPPGVQQSLKLHGEPALPEQGLGDGGDAVFPPRARRHHAARGEPH